MRRVVSLFLPTWPTDRSRRRHGTPPPERPLVTLRPESGRVSIAAIDDAARACGLTPGMSLAHARALVPDLATAPADPAGDTDALTRLAAWCLRRYSPLVAPDPPDGLWLDITGCAHLFGGERPMLEDMTARLAQAGISARAALADTLGAAWALARFAAGADLAIARPGETAAALADLPVAALRLPVETMALLHRLGFATIGRLLDTARAPLARRLGRDLLHRLDQALGASFEPITPLSPPAMARRRIAFPEPIAEPETIARALHRLLPPLCRDLEAAGEGVRRLDLRAHRLDGRITAIRIGTARPSRAADHLAGLLLTQIAALDPGCGIETLELLVPLSEPLRPRQLTVGLGGQESGPDLSALVDRLRARLGPERLYRLGPVESDLPERAVRRLPPLAPPIGASWPAALERPSRLLHPPEPVEAVALLPDHPPLLFIWRRRRHRVHQADGPERVFGEWWRHPAEIGLLRDYFCVVDEEGARFWLFRDGTPEQGGGRWYLHGLFG